MDYLNKIMAHKMVLASYLIIVLAITLCECYGFDAGASCSEKTARRGRAQLLKSIPCDLSVQAYCNLPGNMYPWNAVRRFVSENQGMMKRMYGDVRHISVLRNEINNNDITLDDVEEAAIRYSRTGWKRNKYLHQESSKTKNSDLLSDAHYRRNPNPHIHSRSTIRTTTQVTQQNDLSSAAASDESTTSTTIATIVIRKSKPTEKREKMAIINAKQTKIPSNSQSENGSEYDDVIDAAIEEIVIQFNDESSNNANTLYSNDTDRNLNNKVSIETTTETIDENIKIIGAPDLSISNNKSQPAPTISTTLRIYGLSKDDKVTTSAPFETNTTENSTVKSDELRGEEISTTVENQVNDNLIKIGNEAAVNTNSNDQGDFISIESIKTESAIAPDEFEKDKPDKTHKPFDEQSIGQLYQDVAEKEDPAFYSSRGVNACPVKEEVVAPFWANNTRGEVLALLNLYPFEQYVHWEKCTQEHKQMYCRDGCRCEQQYRLHRLLAYDPHNECRGIFSDWFRFPSCCICKCYNVPFEYRVTSRSPRSMSDDNRREEKQTLNDSIESDEHQHGEHKDNERYPREAHSKDNIMVGRSDDFDF